MRRLPDLEKGADKRKDTRMIETESTATKRISGTKKTRRIGGTEETIAE